MRNIIIFLILFVGIFVTISTCSPYKEMASDNPLVVDSVVTDMQNYPYLAKYVIRDHSGYTWGFIDSLGKFTKGDTLIITKK